MSAAPNPSPPTVLTEDERVALSKAHYLTPPTLEDDPVEQCVNRILAAREALLADRVAAAVRAEREAIEAGIREQCPRTIGEALAIIRNGGAS